MLTCPICDGRLALAGSSVACPRGHTFDMAREGYVNLLAGRIHSRAGDTREMLRARRFFLDRGFYEPLSDRLNALALRHITEHALAPRPIALDAGCGEGYYLGRLRDALDARFGSGSFAFVGIDIAKDAARMAAKRHRDIHFAVADVKRRIPVADQSVTLLLDVFAPRNSAEFTRVVSAGGILLIALPGPRHLAELRERYHLIGIEAEKARHVISQLARSFALVESVTLEYVMELSGEDIRHLLTMTPNARHRERQGWERAGAWDPMRVTASFILLALRRV